MAFASDAQTPRYFFSWSRVSLLRCFLNVRSSFRSSSSCGSVSASSPLGRSFSRESSALSAAGQIAEDRDPVIDLGALDLDRRLQLLLGTHDRMGRHLAEVPREHRVAAALFDLFVGRGPARRHPRVPIDRAIDLRRFEVELLLDQLDFGGLRGRADRRGFAFEILVRRSLGRLRLLLGVSAAARRGFGGPPRHGMERRVTTGSFMADDRGRAALALAHDRCFLARERVGGLGGSLRWAENGRRIGRGRRRNRALRSTRCSKVPPRRTRRGSSA